MISIIIPTYNEEKQIVKTLENLNQIKREIPIEIILVDGSSNDNTVKLSKNLVDKIFISHKCRAIQQNIGASISSGEIILFLHADTIIPKIALKMLEKQQKNIKWGFYNIAFDVMQLKFYILSSCINFRSKVFKYGTGDQCLFVTKNLFNQIGGFPNIDLMEDIAICQKLKKIFYPSILNHSVITSARKWEKEGYLKTILKMKLLRLLYKIGCNPSFLQKYY